MRKNVIKKLRVSKETLLALTRTEAQTVAGGSGTTDASRFSCPSGCVERGGLCPLNITTGTN